MNTPTKTAVSTEINETCLIVRFSDGRKLVVDVAQLDPEIRLQATLHGLKQKLVDAAAIARNQETGASATLDDKFYAVEEVFNRITNLHDPRWNKGRAEGTGGSTDNLLVLALMELKGMTKTQIDLALSNKSKEEKAVLKTNERVAAILTRIQTERSAAKAQALGLDSDDLLASI